MDTNEIGIFIKRTLYIDSYIHMIHCGPLYLDKDEEIIKSVLSKVIDYLLKMFDTFHKHTTALRQCLLQHRQSNDENDYTYLAEICHLINKLVNDSSLEFEASKKVLIIYEKEVQKLNWKVNCLQKSKLIEKMKILKLQLNYTDEKVHVPNISFDFEDPQQYIDKKSENQDETTIQKYTAKVKSESDKWISFYEEKLTNHRQVYMKYCKYWEILKTEIKKEKCDVDFKKKKDIYSHRNSCTINLEETCRVWQIEMSKIEMDYEKEIAAHEAEFKRLKESYEQEYTQACEEIRRISEHRKALNKDICNCKLEIYKFHLERELLINNQKSSLDHQNSKASIRETAVNKFKKSTERSLCENSLLDARVDTQTEDECKHSFGIKICKIKKCQNYKISLNLKSEESRLKKILQLLIDKQEKESEIKKQFAKRHEKTLEYASIFLRDIESSDCKFKKVMNERYQKFNEIVQKHICIINASRSDKIRRFEVDMKNKENQKIIEIKTTLLHQFLRSTQTQLAILENKKILQENLVKEVQSSLDWKACAIKHINCYLLETKQVWRDMESCCSRLMKHMVAKNLIEHRNCTANNTLSKAIKLKYNQQISIFKKQAKQFCEKCEALVNNFDLLDNSFTMIRETISLLIVSKHN